MPIYFDRKPLIHNDTGMRRVHYESAALTAEPGSSEHSNGIKDLEAVRVQSWDHLCRSFAPHESVYAKRLAPDKDVQI